MKITLQEKFAAYQLDRDPDLFADIFDEIGPKLWSLALRLTTSPTEAEDALQETMLRVIRHIGSFDARRPPYPWLSRILANVIKQSKRKRGIHLSDDHSVDLDASTWETPQINQDLQEAIAKLPKGYPSVFQLLIEGLTPQEISQRLKVPAGTVRSRIHRGVTLLRQKLKLGTTVPTIFLIFETNSLATIKEFVLLEAKTLAPQVVVASTKSLWMVGAVTCLLALCLGIWTNIDRTENDSPFESSSLEARGRGEVRRSVGMDNPSIHGADTRKSRQKEDGGTRSRPTSQPTDEFIAHDVLPQVSLQCKPQGSEAKKLQPSTVRLLHNSLDPKTAKPKDWFSFPVSDSGRIVGLVKELGKHHGELSFVGQDFRIPFEGFAIRNPRESWAWPVMYGYQAKAAWPYECDYTIKSVTLVSNIIGTENKKTLSWSDHLVKTKGPVVFPCRIVFSMEGGFSWSKKLQMPPALLKIEVDTLMTVKVINPATGKGVAGAQLRSYSDNNGQIESTTNESGVATTKRNSWIHVSKNGYRETSLRFNPATAKSLGVTIPLVRNSGRGWIFVDETGQALVEKQVGVFFAKSNGDEAINIGRSDAKGLRPLKELRLNAWRITGDLSQEPIIIRIRDGKIPIWQSKEPLTLRDLDSERTFVVTRTKPFRVKVIFPKGEKRGPIYGRAHFLLEDKGSRLAYNCQIRISDDDTVLNFGNLGTEYVEVGLLFENEYPQFQIFRNDGSELHEFHLMPTKVIHGQVTDATGEGTQAGIHVTALSDGDRRFPPGSFRTDKIGHYAIRIPNVGPFLLIPITTSPENLRNSEVRPTEVLIKEFRDHEVNFHYVRTPPVTLTASDEQGRSLGAPTLWNAAFTGWQRSELRSIWLVKWAQGQWLSEEGDARGMPREVNLDCLVVAPGSRPKHMTIRVAENQDRLQLTLPRGPKFSGRVVSTTGEGAEGITIRLKALELKNLRPFIGSPRDIAAWKHDLLTGKDGTFSSAGLTPGTYVIRVFSKAGKYMNIEEEFAIDAPLHLKDIVVPDE